MGAARAINSRTWLVAASLALAIAGCGHAQVVGRGRIVGVGVTEYRVTPQKISISAGPVNLVVHNFGRLSHNLATIRGGRIEAETAPIRPGASVVLTVDLAQGSYVIASTLFDDQPLGTYGTLIVTR